MINTKLLKLNAANNHYIIYTVLANFGVLLANIALVAFFAAFLVNVVTQSLQVQHFINGIVAIGIILIVRLSCGRIAILTSFHAASSIKQVLRTKIYDHYLRMQHMDNVAYPQAQLLQIASEGIEQLELYYARYIPQFFYSMLAPLLLFLILLPMDALVATALLIAVPMIPISIIVVQKIAKKLLGRYWKAYTQLGDRFLDNLQALPTLKIFQADHAYVKRMDEEAESFRKATMRVLVMQLNSIVVMDLVAYLGASVGIFFAILSFQNGNIPLTQALFIIFISADFFIPMRQLGSLFHVAMNGIAASKTMFHILNHPLPNDGHIPLTHVEHINFHNVSFRYHDADTDVLKNVSLSLPQKGLVVIVGASGAGKSTLASCIMRYNQLSEGEITINHRAYGDYTHESIMTKIKYLGAHPFVFQATMRQNLTLGNTTISDTQLIARLNDVGLLAFVESHGGLDMMCGEHGNNLSTGQKQRLCLARALAATSDVLILDEMSANIDRESEQWIMQRLEIVAQQQLIIMITHRLQHATMADSVIFVAKTGQVTHATHEQLMNQHAEYRELVVKQRELENFVEAMYA